jgi:cbb3-type cytochrome oxidase maturation protein
MSVMLVLIFFSISTALLFLFAFVWAVRTGQFEDDYTPSVRILLDDVASSTEFNQKITPNETPSLTPETHASGQV